MTRVDTDQVHVSINGGGNIVELSPGGTADRSPHCHAASRRKAVAASRALDEPRRPHHGHAQFEHQRLDARRHSVRRHRRARRPTGFLPIASSMMPDASKYYVSNYVDSTITCISIGAPACRSGNALVATKTINLLLGGAVARQLRSRSPAPGFSTSGGLPIQTPVSPNGKYVITATTLTGDDHHHRYGDRRTGQGSALQRRMPRRELRREEGRRLLRLRREQVLERLDRPRSRSERRRQRGRRQHRGPHPARPSARVRTRRPTTP